MNQIKYVAFPWDVYISDPKPGTVKSRELREFAVKRIARFFGACRAVLRECAVSADVLWVFLAPEFYLRHEDDFYPEQLMEALIGLIEDNSKQFEPPCLFVIGTAVWRHLAADINTAIVTTSRSVAIAEQGIFVYHKRRASPIDHVTVDAGRPGSFLDGLLRAKRSAAALDLHGPVKGLFDIGHTSVFSVDGIRFGLEICLDHAVHVDSLSGQGVPGGALADQLGASEVDVQLLVAAGMVVNPASIALRRGGCFFRCDGLNDPDARVTAYKQGIGKSGSPVKVEKSVVIDSAHRVAIVYKTVVLRRD
ncbi:MAG TPA: hypothetical protein VHT91_25690 [Kofleriaceae bacterium]|jgi:hypothetical protein|nr:hypothetical protein [Kofleriaceae bacterium]